MQLNTVTKEVERSGDFQTSGFSINQSPEVFEILSSTLYSDPVRAVIREICCNAYDAHVLVDKQDEPFEVHLPTTMDGQFWVRDFGPGLDHTSMVELYTTYFGSNKSHSNNQIGGFGLGSKSPFALTDSFTVVSVHEGVKRSYTAHKDEENNPCLSMLGEVDTDEPSGIKVIVPIKQGQLQQFRNSSEKVLKYFKVLPKINLSIEKPEYDLSGEDWHLTKTQGMRYGSSGTDHIILMGNVAYPFRSDDLNFPEGRFSDSLEFLNNIKLVLEMPIGQVKPQASREKLHIDEKSNDLIVKKIEAVRKQVMQNIQDEVNEQKTLWEASVKATVLTEVFGWTLGSNIRKGLKFNGQPIVERFDKIERHECNVRDYSMSHLRKTVGSVRGSASFQSISVRPNTRFIELETEDQPYPLRLLARIRQAMQNEDEFLPESDGTLFVVEGTKADRDKFFEQLPGCPRKNLLDFKFTPPPKPQRTTSTVRKKTEKTLFPVNRIIGWEETSSGDMRPVTEECEAEGGTYIQTRMGVPLDARGERIDNIHHHIDVFRNLKLLEPGETVYTVPTSFIKVTNSEEWVNLYDRVKPGFIKFHKDLDPDKQQIYRLIKSHLSRDYGKEQQLRKNLEVLLPKCKKPRAVFKKFCEEFDCLLEMSASIGADHTEEVNRVASVFGLERRYPKNRWYRFSELEETEKLRKLYSQIEEKHPFFDQVVHSLRSDYVEQFADAIATQLMTKEV